MGVEKNDAAANLSLTAYFSAMENGFSGDHASSTSVPCALVPWLFVHI